MSPSDRRRIRLIFNWMLVLGLLLQLAGPIPLALAESAGNKALSGLQALLDGPAVLPAELQPATTGAPQLVIEVTMAQERAAVGEVVPLMIRVANPGDSTARGYSLELYITSDLALEDGSTAPDGEPVTILALRDLRPGRSQELSAAVQLNEAVGDYGLISLIAKDGQGVVVATAYAHLENAANAPAGGAEAGSNPELPGGWVFRPNPPQTSLFSGAATYGYPLAVPPARQGLGPSLALGYSSRSADGIRSWVDSGEWGEGWQLNGVPSIIRNGLEYCNNDPSQDASLCAVDSYTLYMDGAHLLTYQSQANGIVVYQATDAPALRVELHNNAPLPALDAGGHIIDHHDPGNVTGLYWIVRAPGGKVYRFGHRVDSEQLLFQMTDATHAGRIPDTGTYRWWLDQADDAFGNRMVVLYKSFAVTGGPYGCGTREPHGQTEPTIHICRDTAVYPQTIRYNSKVANPDHRNPAHWQSEVQFHMSSAGDPVNGGIPIFRTAAKMHTITMHHNTAEVWRYQLEQAEIPCPGGSGVYCPNNTIRRVLQAITFQNRDAAGILQSWPPTLFEYELEHTVGRGIYCSPNPPPFPCTPLTVNYQYPHLERVHNGYGGVYEFHYDSLPWQNDTKSWYVTDRSIWDGVRRVYGQDSQPLQRFNYLFLATNACYDVEGDHGCHDWTVPGSEASHKLVGFRWASVFVYDETNTFQGRTGYHFGVKDNVGHPLLFGRELARWQYADIGGQILLGHSQNVWANGPAAPCTSNTNLNWACLASATNATYELVPSGASTVLVGQNRVVYSYDMTAQGGRQWGLPTNEAQQYWNGSDFELVLRQQTVYADNNNPAHWTVAPTVQQVRDGDNELHQLSLMLYDGNLDPDSQTLQHDSLLSWSRAVVDVSPLQNTGIVNLATVDTHYEYAAGGLLQRVTTFGEYGNQQAISGVDWLPVAPGDFAAANPAVTHSTFSADGLLVTAVTDAAGHQTIYQYGGNTATTPWSMTQATFNPGPAGQTTQYRYDALGRLHQVIAPGANLASPSLQHGYAVFPPTVEYSGGLISAVHYSGLPIMVLKQANPNEGDALRKISRTAYNGLGMAYESRLVDVPRDANPAQRIDLSTAIERSGRLICQSLPLEMQTANPPPANVCGNPTIDHQETLHDMLGRPIQNTAADGSISTMTFATPAMGSAWVGHASLGGVFQSKSVQTGNDGVPHRISYQTYDLLGRLVWIGQWEDAAACTNGRLHLTRYGYDSLGNVTSVERGATLCGSTYNNASVVETQIEYDSLGRKVEMTDPDMGDWEYSYNPAGGIIAQTGGLGTADAVTTCAHYDVLGRPTDQWLGQTNGQCGAIPSAGEANFLSHTNYVTNPANAGLGQVQSVVYDPHIPGLTGDFSDTFFYDSLGRPSNQVRLLNDRSYTQQVLSYDRLGRPLVTVNPAGENETTTYDYWGGETLSVYSSGQTVPLVEEAVHNLRGQLEQLQRGNGVKTSLAYDNVAGGFRLRDVDIMSGPSLLANYHYDYDSAGQITGLRSILQGNIDDQEFTYDTLGRLATAAAYENGSNVPDYNFLYEYDNLGNLSFVRNPATNQAIVSYDNHPQHPHAVWRRHEGGQTFEQAYNALGQMTSREALDPATGQPAAFAQHFDELGRLIQVEKGVDGQTQLTSFAYDPAGLRMVTLRPDGSVVYTPFAGYEESFAAPWVELPIGAADLTAPDHTGWTLATVQEPASIDLSAGAWSQTTDPDYPATSISDEPGVGNPYSPGGRALAVNNLASGAIESDWRNLPIGSSQVTVRVWLRGQLEAAVIGSGGTLVELDFRRPDGTIEGAKVWAEGSLDSEVWQRINQTVSVVPGATQVRVRLVARQVEGWVAFDDLALLSSGQLFYSTGFEEALNGWSELAETDFPATFIWRGNAGPAAPRSGQYSYALGNLMFTTIESPPVPVAPNQQYPVSALVQGQGEAAPAGAFTLAVLFYDTAGAFLSEETIWQMDEHNSSWQSVGGVVLAPSQANTMTVRMRAAYLAGRAGVDDVCVETGWLPVCWDFDDGNQGWIKSNHPEFPAGAAVVLDDAAAEENSYYSLTNSAGGMAQSGLLPVIAGRPYQASAQVRGHSNGGRLVAAFYDSSGTLLSSQTWWSDAQTNGSRAWQLIRATFTAPAGATQVRLGLEGVQLIGWQAVDSMSLAALTEPVTIGTGGWEYEAGVLVYGEADVPAGQDSVSLGVIYYDASGGEIGQITMWAAGAVSFPVPSLQSGSFTPLEAARSFRLVQAMSADNDSQNNWVSFTRPVLSAIGAPITVQSGRLYELTTEVQGHVTYPPETPESSGAQLLTRFYDADGDWQSDISFWQAGSGDWSTWTEVGGYTSVPTGAATMQLVQQLYLSDGWMAFRDMTVMALSDVVAVTAGATYSLTAEVSGVLNAPAGQSSGRLVVLFYNQNGHQMGNPAVIWAANTFNQPNGMEVNGQFTAPLGAVSLRVRMEAPVNYGWLDFDVTSLKVSQQPLPVERISYSLDGQTVALRLTGNTPDAGLYYPHGDHLGSVSLISYGQGHAQAGHVVPESLARYLPFGGYRDGWQPTADLTDRGFTGHKQNDDLGLIYMNARYYDPALRRFISPDTIVPNPADTGSWNRYAYVNNNPINFTDPSGHCGYVTALNGNEEQLVPDTAGDATCWSVYYYLTSLGWVLDPSLDYSYSTDPEILDNLVSGGVAGDLGFKPVMCPVGPCVPPGEFAKSAVIMVDGSPLYQIWKRTKITYSETINKTSWLWLESSLTLEASAKYEVETMLITIGGGGGPLASFMRHAIAYEQAGEAASAARLAALNSLADSSMKYAKGGYIAGTEDFINAIQAVHDINEQMNAQSTALSSAWHAWDWILGNVDPGDGRRESIPQGPLARETWSITFRAPTIYQLSTTRKVFPSAITP